RRRRSVAGCRATSARCAEGTSSRKSWTGKPRPSYLYLTKTTKERSRMQSNFSTLCRGHIIPKELDRETTTK
ncbi:hypothetical protein E7X23_26700, partial [Bacteroides fragilis]